MCHFSGQQPSSRWEQRVFLPLTAQWEPILLREQIGLGHRLLNGKGSHLRLKQQFEQFERVWKQTSADCKDESGVDWRVEMYCKKDEEPTQDNSPFWVIFFFWIPSLELAGTYQKEIMDYLDEWFVLSNDKCFINSLMSHPVSQCLWIFLWT